MLVLLLGRAGMERKGRGVHAIPPERRLHGIFDPLLCRTSNFPMLCLISGQNFPAAAVITTILAYSFSCWALTGLCSRLGDSLSRLHAPPSIPPPPFVHPPTHTARAPETARLCDTSCLNEECDDMRSARCRAGPRSTGPICSAEIAVGRNISA